MKETNYSRVIKLLIGAWFFLAVGISSLHLFRTPPGVPPLPLGLGALLPLCIFGIWFALSSGFREFLLSRDRSVLTMIQTWRIEGFVFLVLCTCKILPARFALTAGWGDMAIGVTAFWAAKRLSDANHRPGFIAWQLLGMLDLITAMVLGSTAGLLDPGGISTSVMTVLPMSLIPTFAIPFLMMLHIICIAQSLQGKEGTALMFGHRSPLTS